MSKSSLVPVQLCTQLHLGLGFSSCLNPGGW